MASGYFTVLLEYSATNLMEMIVVWQLTGDIHEEVESHNRVLDRMVASLFLRPSFPRSNIHRE